MHVPIIDFEEGSIMNFSVFNNFFKIIDQKVYS